MDLLERAEILLKATRDLLEKQENSRYVLDILNQVVFYDGVDCDGHCLKDDIGYWLDELEEQTKTKERPKNMKTILEVKKGYGKAINERGDTFTVLESEGLWNLSRKLKNENVGYFIKENVKRLSTLQRYADKHNYDIEIKEVKN